MKSIIFLVCASLALVSSAKLPDQYRKASEECNADPKTAFALPKPPAGEVRPRGPPALLEYSPQLGAYSFCIYKKFGTMTEDGDIVEAKLKSTLSNFISDEAKLNEIVQKSLVKKDTPEETAYNLYRSTAQFMRPPKRPEQ